jgi:hypothetical protein
MKNQKAFNLAKTSLLIFSLFFLLIQTSYAKDVTYSVSGVMQGDTIFQDGTPFVGSFTYSHPQEPHSSSGDGNSLVTVYMLSSYELTILGNPISIPPVELFGQTFPVEQLTGSTWNTSNFPSISISNGYIDTFRVIVDNVYVDSFIPGRLK